MLEAKAVKAANEIEQTALVMRILAEAPAPLAASAIASSFRRLERNNRLILQDEHIRAVEHRNPLKSLRKQTIQSVASRRIQIDRFRTKAEWLESGFVPYHVGIIACTVDRAQATGRR